MDILKQVLQWPPIAQGALGSAIFWLLLRLLTLLFKLSTSKYLSFSKKNRLERLQAELFRYQACLSDDDAFSTFLFTTIIIGALNNFFKATISICLGWILNIFIPGFLLIGLIFAIYFLFMAALTVRDTDPKVDAKSRVEEIGKEIDLLENKLNKPLNSERAKSG